jgi:transglutaminase-like putative cysteine protease
VLETVEPATGTEGTTLGDSEKCLQSKRGSSADMAALFTSLARSVNIPARLVYGALLPEQDQPAPHGHHAWAEFFALGVGWVPVDCALGDRQTEKERRAYYFGNLDARRVSVTAGRGLTLAPKQEAGPVEALLGVYAEVDGKPHLTLERKMKVIAK